MAKSTIFIVLTVVQLCTQSISSPGQGLGCIESERLALLKLKQSLTDTTNELSSWEGTDCCSWPGVGCRNHTGHVIGLHLDAKSLGGKISPSLLELKFLRSLNLSMNDFGGTRIPDFIGSLTTLKYLDLSNANFGGPVPRQLGNLSSLRYLDLSSGESVSLPSLIVDDLAWISHLSSLRYLGLVAVNLTKATNWILSINKLTHLSELRLAACGLENIPLSLPNLNLTSLVVLDLSGNNFNSTLPGWLFNMTNLTLLDMSTNSLIGSIPDAFERMASLSLLNLKMNILDGEIPRSLGNLCSLKTLDLAWNYIGGNMTELVQGLSQCSSNSMHNLTILNLSHNSINGLIPPSLEKLSSLVQLFLQSNNLNGTVPEGLGQLSNLYSLDISSNSLVGVLSEAHFAKLSRLRELYISYNSLSLEVSPNWSPPFQLNDIYMPSCHLGPQFPQWLRTQKNYTMIKMYNASISDTIPSWFWSLTSQIISMNFSLNQIKGSLPPSLELVSISILDLSFNQLEGPLPRFNPDIIVLNLYGNNFSGALPSDIGVAYPMLMNLLLAKNFIDGSIPQSICEMESLEVLGLSDNHLSGVLPHCWNSSQTLAIIDLGNNNISGNLPDSLGSLNTLTSLHLNNNSLSGVLPSSLKNCTRLVALDIGENRLSGSIPSWIGKNLSNLMILRMRSNRFTGRIPIELSHLTSLRVLDIANNSLSGIMPASFGNFTAMREAENYQDLLYTIWGSYEDNVLVFMKGMELEYSKTLAMVTSIDFSSNRLVGEIPEELTTLSGLRVLNFSGNMLTGEIPKSMGNLRWLESLDLSRNRLSGFIPHSMSALTSLSHLNLSYNNLQGRIPSGFQLQTLDDPSIYVGNPHLCGAPLVDLCPEDFVQPTVPIDSNKDEDDQNNSEMVWFYSSITPGFALGFSIVWGVLLLRGTWRVAYFRVIDNLADWLYVSVALNMAKLSRRLDSIKSYHHGEN